MSGEKISRALSDISDEKIAAAASIQPFRRNVWRRMVVAAAIAILMTVMWPGRTEDGVVVAPGVLKVYAYDVMEGIDAEQMTKSELTNSVTISENNLPLWSPFVNVICKGIPLYFEIPEEYFGDAHITYELCVDYGQFWKYSEYTSEDTAGDMKKTVLGNTVTIENAEYVYWEGYGGSRVSLTDEDAFIFFADILIRADGQLAGYGVIEFCYDKNELVCMAFHCETYCFPMRDGQLQKVSDEYVAEQIAGIKATATMPTRKLEDAT